MSAFDVSDSPLVTVTPGTIRLPSAGQRAIATLRQTLASMDPGVQAIADLSLALRLVEVSK
jgi:hypothetical protein